MCRCAVADADPKRRRRSPCRSARWPADGAPAPRACVSGTAGRLGRARRPAPIAMNSFTAAIDRALCRRGTGAGEEPSSTRRRAVRNERGQFARVVDAADHFESLPRHAPAVGQRTRPRFGRHVRRQPSSASNATIPSWVIAGAREFARTAPAVALSGQPKADLGVACRCTSPSSSPAARRVPLDSTRRMQQRATRVRSPQRIRCDTRSGCRRRIHNRRRAAADRAPERER